MENNAFVHIKLALVYSGSGVDHCPESNHSYDSEFDDERSVIGDGCEVLARLSTMRFLVNAFAQDHWLVDVETDLAVILEQLPNVLSELREGRPTILDFYEQGLERALIFAGEGVSVEIRCRSQHPTWKFDRATIFMKRSEVIAMLQKLGDDFVDFLEQACRNLADHPWLREWQRKLRSQSPA